MIAVLAAAGIMADGWFMPLDVHAVPEVWTAPSGVDFAAVVELPVSPATDPDPMYRATTHGRPIANGNSGFFPMHYYALLQLLDTGNPRALQAIGGGKPVLVVVNRAFDPDGRWNRMMSQAEYSTRVHDDKHWTMYRLVPPAPKTCTAPDLSIASLTDQNHMTIDLHPLTDNNIETWWSSAKPQHFDDHLDIDLGKTAKLCAVGTSLGTAWQAWPHDLDVLTSSDGVTWTRQFKGSPGRQLIEGAVANPLDVWLTVPLNGAQARYVRLRLDSDESRPWMMTELRVTGF
jgi:hypothetical protein